MSLNGELLVDSLWFKTLQRRHAATLLRAANEGLFVLVPQSSSLETPVVSAEGIQHHIIRPDGTRGNHVTLSGRRVIVTSSEVCADSGFPRQLSAAVLQAQRLVIDRRTAALVRGHRGALTDDQLSLNCYFISRPLDGGLVGPANSDELDHGAILAAVAMLRSSPETELVFQHLSATNARIKQRCTAGPVSEGDLDAIQAELHAEWLAAARALSQTSFYSGDSAAAQVNSVLQLAQTVESWSMEQLSEQLLLRTTECVASQCAALRPAMARHAGRTAAEFGVKPKIRCNLSASVGCLALVQTAATPLEKLHCLRDTVQLTIKCVTRHLEESGVDLDDVELGSDDILDMLLFIIASAHGTGADMSELPGHLEYAYRFHVVPRGDFETSRLGYYYSTFHQALQFFALDRDPAGSGSPDPDAGTEREASAAAAASGSGERPRPEVVIPAS
jgi:hypothetical protein